MTQPSTIAHYNLLERIGEGGIGEVYRARDTRVGRTVALKIVSPAIAADPDRLQHLLADARAATALSHPNIATLWDVGEADGVHYLAYEFTAGQRLREEAGGAAMNPRRAIDLSVQVADGVADAHAHGIIHGDLRPETIVVTQKGSAKILDFGMGPWTESGAARIRAAQSPDTVPVDAIGIVSYMSPEEAIGGAVDGRTDVFSLGTLTYELVTGQNPFAGRTASDTVLNLIKGKVTPPSERNAMVPAELDAVVVKALSPDIAQRQQSAASLAAELRSVAAILDVRSGDSPEPTTTAALPIDETPDRNSAVLLTAALLIAAAAAGVVWWWLNH